MAPSALVETLNRFVLADLPAPEVFDTRAAKQLLVHLSFCGASVARHYQEWDFDRRVTPERAFEPVLVGPDRIPFRRYFARLAAQTRTGHGDRDSYVTLVQWNVPTVEVRWAGAPLAVLPGVFDDGSVRTYTGEPGERLFFELVKKSETVELAVNNTLRPISDGAVGVESGEAMYRVWLATALLNVLRQLGSDFGQLPADAGLRPDYFIDVFRQFAVHWEVGDLPPSGAQDVEGIKRDLLLGLDLPGLAGHVRRQFPGLLAADRADVTTLLDRPPVPRQLLTALRLDPAAMWEMSALELRRAVRRHPALAAWYLLLNAHARAAAAHLALAKKFLFRPAQARQAAGIPDLGLVSRTTGTTGMDESLLDELTRARHNHVLAPLHQVPNLELAGLGGIEAPPSMLKAGRPAIIRVLDDEPGPDLQLVGPQPDPDLAGRLASTR